MFDYTHVITFFVSISFILNLFFFVLIVGMGVSLWKIGKNYMEASNQLDFLKGNERIVNNFESLFESLASLENIILEVRKYAVYSDEPIFIEFYKEIGNVLDKMADLNYDRDGDPTRKK